MRFWKDKGIPHATPVPIFGNTTKSTCLMEPFSDTIKKMYNEFENERQVNRKYLSIITVFILAQLYFVIDILECSSLLILLCVSAIWNSSNN